ncbi:fumarate hydratase subunit alpha [Desulfonatronum thiosulfatophilum]|uniref:Fumarate hydratase subunit alpha n=1 Tax=Desulfonatronum thiosulfatophilum TaxID=617002 RepID=A0A1G6D392_9BACT|nr:fumarate hydratase [Desulfonatronum thiosulfatophilum]SDB39551.1 fumarate hydratase subunit alpha [Desulfonatronum thiosulfatophilum]
MRTVNAATIADQVAKMVVQANRILPEDVLGAISRAKEAESSSSGREILAQLEENAALARESGLPLCQDTGMAVFFVELGEDCRVEGAGVRDAVTEGMIRGYQDGLLRKSMCHPLTRKNTGDNSPAVIHIDLVPGDGLKIAFMAKGGGSENMSRVTMLSPAQGWKGVKEFVLTRVAEAGPNPCPPIMLGIGIGGSFELAPKLAKQALLRPLDQAHPDPEIAKMEQELLSEINDLGIGPMGLGGDATCLGVRINMAPCHIASLPLAVNVQCHSARHEEVEL